MFKNQTCITGDDTTVKYWPLFGLMILLFTGVISDAYAQTTYNPVRYYTFNGPSAKTDQMGNFDLDFTTYNSPYTVGTNGQVSNYLTLNKNSALVSAGPYSLTNAFTIEFLLKPGAEFNTCRFLQRGDGAVVIAMQYPSITFTTTHKSATGATISDQFVINLDGIGRKSYGYYVDGNWHHMVFRFNGSTGVKDIWVDGQSPAGFSKTISTGTFTNSGNYNFYLNHNVDYVKYFGSIDELALYTTAIPNNLIYKHYLGIQSGQTYNFVDNYTSGIPAPSPVTAGLNMNEFAPGHPNVNVTATNQLLTFAAPRYKPGHTLHANLPLYGIEYLGGMHQSGVSYAQFLGEAKIQQVDLIKNFNQSILIASNSHEYGYYDDTTKFAGWFLRYANNNPSKHASVFTFWPSVNPSIIGRNQTGSYVLCGCLSNNHYLRNSSGQFLDQWGNVSSYKTISPAAPVDSLAYDGLTQRYYLTQLVTRLSRPLNTIFDNGEVIPIINNSTVLSKDPAVVADKNSTGLSWYTYEARRTKEKVLAYTNQFMSLSQLANTKFVYYAVDGQVTYRHDYNEMRLVNTPLNGQRYPSGDIYMRYPSNWRYWVSSWHGWQWVAESRHVELAAGDKLFSPAVSPGWDINEESNVRPGQWLGMLKTFSMAGAEFFYTSYFNLQPPYANSKNWVWQVVMPAYSQAISSRYEDFLRNGYLMEGDVPNDYVNPSWNAYSFAAQDLRKLVVIRKHNTLQKYAITGTIQPNSSMIGNAELESIATINLDGSQIKFKVRRQGSTYIYDKTGSSPVFYQLDGWHEATHPYYWTKDFIFEAELFDNTNPNAVIKTSVPAGTPAGDFTNFTSYISFNSTGTVSYNFLPRLGAASTQYLWVRARSKDGTATGFTVNLNGNNSNTFDCIIDTNWVWYRINTSNAIVAFSGITQSEQVLNITALNSKIEIEKIHLTSNSGTIYSSVPNPCSTIQATITANGPTSFCAGGTVTLTASSGTSYLWSNGSTSQNIYVSNSGTYTVTVTTAGVGSSTSSPVTVTVYSLPTASISASGSTTFCQGGSVTLTASSGAAFQWFPTGQTTQSITVSTSGTFNVRVTNANGCSSLSSNTVVTSNTPPTASVSAGGATTFCQGGSVTLTSNMATSYLWTPGNQTTQSVNATTSGNYKVTVTDGNGCTATSSGVNVTVNPTPAATITPSGSLNLTSGQSVTLTASSGTAYLWSPGNQTTQSINVNTAGSYSVRVTNAYGCTALSAPAVVTVGSAPVATITASGPTSFCDGGLVTLTASSGNSYQWSNGATSQSITVASTGTYTVTVTTNGVPSTSSPTSVNVYPLPTATITPSASTTICNGSSITLTASSGSSYLWSPNGQTTSSINVSTAGTWQVAVTNQYGCSRLSSPLTTTVTTCSTTACDPPYGLTTLNVTATSATIRWSNPGTGQTSFQVKLKDMTQGYAYSAGIVPATTLQITVGAVPNSEFRWWVRSWCGRVKSPYAGYLTYFTPSLRENEDDGATDGEFIYDLIPLNELEDDFDEPSIVLTENDVQVFPNPASESATITFKADTDETYSLSLLEANGKAVSTVELEGIEGYNIRTFDVSQLPRGIYFVRLMSNTQNIVKRLAVQ